MELMMSYFIHAFSLHRFRFKNLFFKHPKLAPFAVRASLSAAQEIQGHKFSWQHTNEIKELKGKYEKGAEEKRDKQVKKKKEKKEDKKSKNDCGTDRSCRDQKRIIHLDFIIHRKRRRPRFVQTVRHSFSKKVIRLKIFSGKIFQNNQKGIVL